MVVLQENQRKKWEQSDKEKEEKRQIANRGCQCGEYIECYDNMRESSHRDYEKNWKEVVTEQEKFLKNKGINVSYNYNDSDSDHPPETKIKQKKSKDKTQSNYNQEVSGRTQ